MLISRVWDVLCARFLGKEVVMFPNSVGPFRTWLGRFLARVALNSMNFILIRDAISERCVNSLEVETSRFLTFDTAILLESGEDVNFDGFPHPLLGVSPGFYAQSLSKREIDRYIMEHAKLLDKVIEKYGFFVIFLPHYVSGFPCDDLEVSKMIWRLMKNKHRAVIYEACSVETFKAALDHMDLVISSKMHPAVLAISGSVPALCIAYDQKQIGFFELLDLLNCVVTIKDFSCENMLYKIEGVWKEHEKFRSMLTVRISAARENVLEAIKFALGSLKILEGLNGQLS